MPNPTPESLATQWADLIAALPQWWDRLWQGAVNPGTLAQVALLLLSYGLSRLLAPRIQSLTSHLAKTFAKRAPLDALREPLAAVTQPLAWFLLLLLARVGTEQAGWPFQLFTVFINLLGAWVVIRLSASVIRERSWSRLIAGVAWTAAALNVLGLLQPTLAILDALAVNFGDMRISAFSVLKGLFSLAVFLWLASLASQTLERRIMSLPTLTPSIQVLFSKLLKVIFITVALLASLSAVGIDLTGFAVFTGAVGVGVGFGLQKVVSNLISGVILLLDKSVKPGDVIAVGDTWGFISSLGARYVSVSAKDGKEYLIPNEDLVTNQVENWSHSNNEILLRTPIGISYNADVRKAMDLCIEAARETPRVLQGRGPNCLLVGFGDSSVDLSLNFWINDPKEGIRNVTSQVLLRVWDKFHEHGIEIPFPQRDVHIRDLEAIVEALKKGQEN